MIARLLFLLFCGHIALTLGNAQKLPRVKRQSLKVQINATDDTVCMKYLRPSQNTKLEGFVLGYGSSFFSNQYIPLPSEGKTYTTELDAEPRYLISVRPARNSNNKKSCSGRSKTQKPLQLVVGTLTPTSVFLSWGILVNPQHDWTATSNCASDRFYTVRYREKDKEKKWVFQLCPVTETVVDNLKPNTLYEFGVKDNIEDSVWSKTLNHKTVLSNKKVNGQLQNMYKLVPSTQTQLTLRDNKKLVPVTIIKQVIQNRTLSKTSDISSLPGAILVHLIVPGLNETQQKLPSPLAIDDLSQASKKQIAKNETQPWPAESKTPEVQEISPQALPAETEKYSGPEEFKSTRKPELTQTESILASNEIQPHPPGSRIYDAPKSPLTELASHDFLHVTSTPQTFATPEISDTARSTTELEISMPVTTTEPHFLGTALDEMKLLSSRLKTSSLPEMLPTSAGNDISPHLSPDFLHVTSTFQTSASAEMSETETAADETQPVSSRSTIPGIPEMATTKSVTSESILESFTPKSSRPFQWPRATLVPKETPLAPSKLKPSVTPEVRHVKPAPKPPLFEHSTPKTSQTSEQPKATLAPKEAKPIPSTSKPTPSARTKKPQIKPVPSKTSPSKPKLFLHSEEPMTIQAAPVPVSVTTENPYTFEHPKTSEVPAETQFIPTQTKISPQPEPYSKSDFCCTNSNILVLRLIAYLRVSESIAFRIESPGSTIAPKETHHIPSKPKTSPKLHIPHATGVLESVTFRTDEPKTTIVPKETHHVPSKPKTSPSSEVPHTKPVLDPIMFKTEKPKSTVAPRDTRRGPFKPKTSPTPRVPPTRASPKESRRVSPKPKASPSPDISQTKPAPKDLPHTPFKPKAAPIPDASYTKPEIIPPFHEPLTTMIPHITERTKATLAPTEKQLIPIKPKAPPKPRLPHIKPAIHQTTPQPLITKSATTTEQTRATMAPKETLLIPSKPKTSVGPEVPQTKPAPRTTHLGSINLITVHVVDGSKMTLVPNETYQLSPRPKSSLVTEIPQSKTAPHKTRLTSARPKPSDKSQTRPALTRTTLAPVRTRTPGLPKWIAPATDRDDVYTPEDIVKLIGAEIEKPMEHSDTWEKTFPVTTSPGPRRPPVPPVRPTQMRRKPLPPNTVTGKPGSPAKHAGPTTFVKTGVPYKTPTASATPDYYVDATVFSSSPTSETDSSGKPRYQAPHVKYMKKDDDVPCSITSSLEHFPQEEGGSKEEATRPPQNPPTNLTVVTVEGCPTFVILDWEKPDNDTVTEYEVVSTENGASDGEKEQSIITTNQTHSTVENLKPDTSYEFHVKPRNPLGEGPSSNVVAFNTESADPRVSEPISMGKDAIWTEIPFNSDTYSECKGKQYVKRTWYKKFVGVQLCNSLRYQIYLSDSLTGQFYNIGDQRGHGEDHCQFVDSFLDGRTGQQDDLPVKDGFFRAVRQEPVKFGKIGGETHINYVLWYECGTSIPGKW
ncbi:PREDICTED: target of Nesh-SH3 [Tinamus guttatus]|uniref:target of Nesh-SH3 n=1 Tax=Tinamus guttatus TaxID=94827 RepID=UPI00052E9A10|nr:PREDICTED: target of Nesh-SH3 [Tinamus guttatus]